MSGGHFNDGERIYFKVMGFADELLCSLEDEPEEGEETIIEEVGGECKELLRARVDEIQRVAEAMRLIDRLFSGDMGEESFMGAVRADSPRTVQSCPGR